MVEGSEQIGAGRDNEKTECLKFSSAAWLNQTKPPDYLKGNRDDSARTKEQQRGCTGRHRLVTSIDPTRNSYQGGTKCCGSLHNDPKTVGVRQRNAALSIKPSWEDEDDDDG